MTTDRIAELCHEANRAYCKMIGDNSQPSWADAPEWQQKSAIEGVLAHWRELTDGRCMPASASHDSWMAHKLAEGWKWGPVKDPALKTHPSLVDYDDLPESERIKDYLFGGIVEALFKASKRDD